MRPLQCIMLKKITIQHLDETLVRQSGISAAMLRLDQLHPVVSGNKMFKLKYLVRQF